MVMMTGPDLPAGSASTSLADPLRQHIDLSSFQNKLSSAAGGSAAAASSDQVTSILKVNQVDAHVLDQELIDLLRIQLGVMLSPPFLPAGFMDRFKPEINALLDFLLFRFTIFRNEPTPGMRMQNLKFVDGIAGPNTGRPRGTPPRPSQRLSLGVLYIGGRWLFARLRRHALMAGWSESDATPWQKFANKCLQRGESLFRLAWLINFLVFLKYGKYPSLLQRLTGMRFLYRDALAISSRNINFQFMNRQLLWEHFTQLALCVLPLVDWDALRRQVSGLIRHRRSGTSEGLPGAGETDGDLSCAICGEEEAQTPYVTDCGHIYCYYCLKTACLQDDQYACPRCGQYFATSRRWVVAR